MVREAARPLGALTRRWATALLLTFAVSACGGTQTGSSSPGTTKAPGTSGTFSTAKFSVAVPNGWRNETNNHSEVSRFSQNGTVLLLFEASPPGTVQPNVNDVTANVNIVLAGSPVPDDQLAFYLTSVSQSGASNISQPQPFMVDGHAGVYITYNSDVSGTPGQSQDMVVNYKGDTYDIILNTSKQAFPLQLPALKLMLDTWRWKG